MKLGAKIKELRLERGLSQMQLSKLIGVSQKAIDYWERGINEPKASYIIALVKAFEITFDEFFVDIFKSHSLYMGAIFSFLLFENLKIF